MESDTELLGIGAAAKELGISIARLRGLADQGRVSSARTSGGHRRFDSRTLHQEWAAMQGFGSDVVPVRTDSRTWDLEGLDESVVWRVLREDIEAQIGELPAVVRTVWAYAVTEMVNNAIDHSAGETVEVSFRAGPRHVVIWVEDDGVGVLERIATGFGLSSPLDALVELTKGKRTTAPDQHSGEGIFFTSKAVDVFDLAANGARIVFDNPRDDVAFGVSSTIGTTIRMELANDTTRTLARVFAAYTDDHEFDRSVPRIELVTLDGEFISRSEAKRFVLGLEEFRRVDLDFTGVEMIGQGFADEVFRVWGSAHRDVEIQVVGANPAVAMMIGRVRRADGAADTGVGKIR